MLNARHTEFIAQWHSSANATIQKSYEPLLNVHMKCSIFSRQLHPMWKKKLTLYLENVSLKINFISFAYGMDIFAILALFWNFGLLFFFSSNKIWVLPNIQSF